MTSLEVESLITNILLEETIEISCDSLYKKQELLSNINKNKFEKLLEAAFWNNYFLFDSIVYQQVDGLAIGSSLSSSLANTFLAHYKQILLHYYFKNVVKKRSSPTTLADNFIKILLNTQFLQKILELTASKKKLFTVLAYLGLSSLCLITHLQTSIYSIYSNIL